MRPFSHADATKLHEAMSGLPSAGPDLLVALDLDGTTIRHDTSLSPRVAEAVHAHLQAGTHIVIATGRGIDATMIVAEQLVLPNGMAVCANGAITLSREVGVVEPGIFPGARLIDYTTFNPAGEIETIMTYVPEALLAVEPARGPRRLSAPFPRGELVGNSVILPPDQLAGDDATRLTVRAPTLSAEELQDRIDGLGLDGVEYAVGWTAWLDISPFGVSKATALEKLRQEYGMPTSNVLAVGDGDNDIEMLGWAGTGISMGEADDRVHAAADARTASVTDDGLAIVLERLL
ncbi:HAD family hydrolase [Flaviflexus huanghaiensis]|uniref:HAD family hydrolase n=1 Tax=Flaviflexus huanghaiensis TaxID=1111473 RepID=UPI0030CA475E